MSRFAVQPTLGRPMLEWLSDVPQAYAVLRNPMKSPRLSGRLMSRYSVQKNGGRWRETGFLLWGFGSHENPRPFIVSVKSPELAKRFSDKVPTTVNEMMERGHRHSESTRPVESRRDEYKYKLQGIEHTYCVIEQVQDHNVFKGKEVTDEDLKKPFKEARRTHFTSRIIKFADPEYKMPNNIKFINEWADLRKAFAARFSVRRACFKEPHEITNIIRKANESLTTFKERWTMETGFIMRVPEVIKILSFMNSVKSPELAKHFSDKVPTTMNEMMERLDEFVCSKEAYTNTELHKRETGESHRKISFPFNRRDTRPFRSTRPIESRRDEYKNNYRGRDVYRATRARDNRAPYPTSRGEYNRRAAPMLTLDSLTKIRKTKSPSEGCATERKEIPWPRQSITSKDNQLISLKDIFEEPLIVEAEVEGYLSKDKGEVKRDPHGPGRVRRRGVKTAREARAKNLLSHSLYYSLDGEVFDSKRDSYDGYPDNHHCRM
ncbi:hypothetical protein Tco_1505971 [Tanacetum coccineum]